MPLQALHALVTQTGQEAAETELPMPPLAFGIVTFCVLLALLLVTFAFRNLGARH